MLPPPLPIEVTKISDLMKVDVGTSVHVVGMVISVGSLEATRFGDKSTRRVRIADTSNKSVSLKLYASDLCDIGVTDGMVLRCSVAEVEELKGVKALKAFMPNFELDVREEAARALRVHFANDAQPSLRWSQVTPLRPDLSFKPVSELLDGRSVEIDALLEVLEKGPTENTWNEGMVRIRFVTRDVMAVGDGGGGVPFVITANEEEPILSLLQPHAKVAVHRARKYSWKQEQQVRAYGENVFLEEGPSLVREDPLRVGFADGCSDGETSSRSNSSRSFRSNSSWTSWPSEDSDASVDDTMSQRSLFLSNGAHPSPGSADEGGLYAGLGESNDDETDYSDDDTDCSDGKTDCSERFDTNASTSDKSFVVSDNASVHSGSDSEGALREQELDRRNAETRRAKKDHQREMLQRMKKVLNYLDTMLMAADVTNTLSSEGKPEELTKIIDSASSYLKQAKQIWRSLDNSLGARKRLRSVDCNGQDEDACRSTRNVLPRTRRRACASESDEMEMVDLLPVGHATAGTEIETCRLGELGGRPRLVDSRSCPLGESEHWLNPYGTMDGTMDGKMKTIQRELVECSIQATKEMAATGEGARAGELAFPCRRKFAVTVCCSSSSRNAAGRM